MFEHFLNTININEFVYEDEKEDLCDLIFYYSFDSFRDFMQDYGLEHINKLISDPFKNELNKLDYHRLIDLYNWWEIRRNIDYGNFNEDTNNLLRLISLRHLLIK